MVLDTMAFGKIIWHTVEVDSCMQKAIFTMENGTKIKLMDTEFNKILKGVVTKVNGKTTNNTAMASKSGQTAAPTKANTKKKTRTTTKPTPSTRLVIVV